MAEFSDYQNLEVLCPHVARIVSSCHRCVLASTLTYEQFLKDLQGLTRCLLLPRKGALAVCDISPAVVCRIAF